MRQHTGEFVLPFNQGQESTRHVDATSGNGKGVGLTLVHDLKRELPAGVVYGCGQPCAQFAKVDIGLGQ